MDQPVISFAFILLCSIQIFTLGFSLLTSVNGIKRWLNVDPLDIMLRKSVKYFNFILLTISCSSFFTLFINFFYLATKDGFIAGYLYEIIIMCLLVNIFCAWQFLTYLIHPERRKTKYPIGICCIIGIIVSWFYPPVVNNVLYSPFLENFFIYIFILCIYGFVYIILSYEFFKYSYHSSEIKEKYRFFCLGVSALFSILMFLGYFLGLIFTWSVVLHSTIFLYLGYNFPKFFQRFLKV